MSDLPISGGEQDPRTLLADSFRDFAVRAIHQQEEDEIEALRRRRGPEEERLEATETLPAGFLYKIENGLVKLLIAEPESDEAFYTSDAGRTQTDEPLPLIWISIPVPPDYPGNQQEEPLNELDIEEQAEGLEAIVFSAEDILIKRVFKNRQPERRLSGDKYFVPYMSDDIEAAAQFLLEGGVTDEAGQVKEAAELYSQIGRYELRSFRSGSLDKSSEPVDASRTE